MNEWLGVARSLVTYWRPGRQRRLRRMYGPFIAPGDLVFDLGAHLGDRSVAFAGLGARVVALEPQPHIVRWLRRIVGRNRSITVVPKAVGARAGRARLSISERTPTVSTVDQAWQSSLPESNSGFRGVRWNRSVEVPMTTLDALIETYGRPAFCKVDVEGHEAEVLAGLSQALPGLSVEFVLGGFEVAIACVRRLEKLGAYRFNAARGEERSFVFDSWVSPDRIVGWLEGGAGGASSGDLYARLESDV